MEPNALTQMAVVLCGLAAAGGLLIAVMRLAGVPRPPHWLVVGYGVAIAFGLVLLCIVASTSGIPVMAQVALAPLFLAVGSDTILNRLIHRNRLPRSLAVLRAFLAGAGFVLLLVSIYGQIYVAKLPVPTMVNSG